MDRPATTHVRSGEERVPTPPPQNALRGILAALSVPEPAAPSSTSTSTSTSAPPPATTNAARYTEEQLRAAERAAALRERAVALAIGARAGWRVAVDTFGAELAALRFRKEPTDADQARIAEAFMEPLAKADVQGLESTQASPGAAADAGGPAGAATGARVALAGLPEAVAASEPAEARPGAQEAATAGAAAADRAGGRDRPDADEASPQGPAAAEATREAPAGTSAEEEGDAGAEASDAETAVVEGGALALLRALVRSGPLPLPLELWGGFTGKSPTSGWWRRTMAQFRRRKLIEDAGRGFVATAAGVEVSGEPMGDVHDEVQLWALWRDRIRELVGPAPVDLLALLARHRGYWLSGEQWALLANDRSTESGHWRRSMASLRAWGLLSEATGHFTASPKGLAILLPHERDEIADTARDLYEARRAQLGKKEAAALRLYDVLQDGMDRDALRRAASTGPKELSANSGYWRRTIAALTSSPLVEETGGGVLRKVTEPLVKV
jgi:hypothetical protein